jgi:3-oxoacyl-[acyl-carrier protein] reductase
MIIVTGASRGIGFAICDKLQGLGMQVLGIARNVDGLPFPAVACDVTDYETLKNISKGLRIDGTEVTALINAAGIASMNLALTTPPEVTARVINVNLLGTIFASQIFAPLMIRRKHGQIINFSTIAVPLSLKGESIYSASKAGVESFTKTLARELSDFGIRVNCVSPGPIDTDLIRGVSQSQISKIVSAQIVQKQLSTADVTDLIEILLDERSHHITGHILHLGGV